MNSTVIIYDLDDTIMSTRSIPESTFAHVFSLIRKANNKVTPNQLENAFNELWHKPLDVVAQKYGFSQVMIDECRNALINTEYNLNVEPYDDFEAIKSIEAIRILVTTGITKLQQAKIDSLFTQGDFDEIIIDDPYQENRLGKKNIFFNIAERYKVQPEQVWIIGDNPDSEIAAGNALGMNTVQILRPGVDRSDKSHYTITSFYELKMLIHKNK
jgi:putative hydrolase of the HAD superfamily